MTTLNHVFLSAMNMLKPSTQSLTKGHQAQPVTFSGAGNSFATSKALRFGKVSYSSTPTGPFANGEKDSDSDVHED